MLTGYAVVGDVFGEVTNGLINIFIVKPWEETQMRQALEHGGAAVDSRRRSKSE